MPESPLERLRRLEAEQRRGDLPASRRGKVATEGNALKRGGIGAVAIAALLFVLTKGKLVLFFLLTKGKLLFGALKVGPLLTTFSTMGLSAWIYAKYYGAWLAIGIVVLILVHELGHGLAARLMKLKVGAPVFIPFFGAMIALKEQLRSSWQDAVIGFGGPFVGTLGGLAVLLGAFLSPPGELRDFLFVLAWFTFYINLFNLAPFWQLDGARITRPMRTVHWLLGSLFLAAVMLTEIDLVGRVNPFLLIIALICGFRGLAQWWKNRSPATPGPRRAVDRLQPDPEAFPEEEDVTPRQRLTAAVAFFALAGALSLLILYATEAGPGLRTS